MKRVLVKVSATLEEICSGVDKPASFSWDKPCNECNKSGCKKGKSGSKCRECRGSGMIVHIQPLAPGIIQQFPMPCSKCNGRGVYISRSDRCATCGGKQTIRTDETISIRVPKGTIHGSRLSPALTSMVRLLEEEGVLFVLDESRHPIFQRRSQHLVLKRTVPLVAALTGIAFNVLGVDGITLRVSNPPNTVAKPGSVFRLAGQGLPKVQNTSERGDLVVQIDVEFPTTLPAQIQLILKRCLPHDSVEDVKSADETTTNKQEPPRTVDVQLLALDQQEALRILNEIPQF
jgi:DnaJ homolog subfamily A member 2